MNAQVFSAFALAVLLQPLHAAEAIREVSSEAILAPNQAIPAHGNLFFGGAFNTGVIRASWLDPWLSYQPGQAARTAAHRRTPVDWSEWKKRFSVKRTMRG